MTEGTITDEATPVREELASFALLGASVPFISPRLLGARIRVVPRQHDFELVLINPAQAKGSYIIPWKSLQDIGSPTLFDLRLWAMLSKAKEIHPTAIRREALVVSAEGLAGRHTAKAAQDAMAEERKNEGRLLAAFAGQCLGGPPAKLSYAAELRPDELQHVQALQTLSVRSPGLMEHLQALAATVSFIGPRNEADTSPLRRLISEIATMIGEMRAFLREDDEGSETAALKYLIRASEAALHYAELAITDVEAKLEHIVASLMRADAEAEKVLARARRPEWILDGWGILVALWCRTSPLMRSSIIWDLVSLVPPVPREVQDWFKPDQIRKPPAKLSRMVASATDWRSGQSLEITARNEHLISFNLHYENRMTPMGLRPRGPSRIRIPKYRGSSRSLTRIGSRGAETSHPSLQGFSDLMGNLGSISDENLMRIVAMIDRLPERSRLDALLSDARPRLAQLRPPRPVTFTRLLFLPLAGALVDPSDWRREPQTIPRTALHLISTTISTFLGEASRGLAEALRPAVFSDIAVVEKFGRPIWEGAARVGERISPDQAWADAGFSAEDFRSIMDLATSVWRHADAIWDVLRQGDSPISVDSLRAALSGAASEGLFAFSASYRTLLRVVSNPSAFAALLAGGMPPGTSDMALEILEDWIEGSLPKLPEYHASEAAERAEDLGKMIETLGKTSFFQMPRRRKVISGFFWRLEQNCRVILLEIINEQVLPALAPSSTPFSDLAFAQLEQQARAARRLGILGRHFGNDPSYEEIERKLITAFAAASQETKALAISPVDLVRLGEILLGREKARVLLSV